MNDDLRIGDELDVSVPAGDFVIADDFTAYTWYEDATGADGNARTGYMDLGDVPLPDNIAVFTCGPLPFMRMVRSSLLKRGVPSDHIRYEVFGPDLWAASELD